MRMEAGLDTGPVLMSKAISIDEEDTAGTVHDRLAALGAQCIVECLRALEQDELHAVVQPEAGVTYARKIDKLEAVIDWSKSAAEIDRQVRAFNPFPIASTSLQGESLRIWHARPVRGPHGDPGRIIDASKDGIVVGCGEGALCVLELQRASAKRLTAAEFLLGNPLSRGTRLGA